MSSPFLATVFEPAAKAKGLHVMKDDINFIARSILKVPYDERKAVLRRYIDEWCKGIAESKNAACGQNAGRRRANLYLLGVITCK